MYMCLVVCLSNISKCRQNFDVNISCRTKLKFHANFIPWYLSEIIYTLTGNLIYLPFICCLKITYTGQLNNVHDHWSMVRFAIIHSLIKQPHFNKDTVHKMFYKEDWCTTRTEETAFFFDKCRSKMSTADGTKTK